MCTQKKHNLRRGHNTGAFGYTISKLSSLTPSLRIFVQDIIQGEGMMSKGQEECRWEFWIHQQKNIFQNLGLGEEKEYNNFYSSIIMENTE